jgi:hypothetical protein
MSYRQDSILGELFPGDALPELVRLCIHAACRFIKD